MRVRLNTFRRGCVVVLLLLMPLANLQLSAEKLKSSRTVLTGSTPLSVATGDFNGDGKPDLAYTDGGFPLTLHILMGNGDGSFSHGQDIPLPSELAGALTIADVNNDGRLDILIGCDGPTPEIGALLGNGDGTFGNVILSVLPVTLPGFANMQSSFGVTDLNGDGAVDVIAGDPQNDAVFVLMGNNTGSFTFKSQIFNGGAPGPVFTGDFNGDGKPDVIVRSFGGNDATVYLGVGDGTVLPGVSYRGPSNITSLLLADMDGDGHLDMVVTGFDNSISILRGNADGTFTNVSSGGTTLSGLSTLIAVRDFNGDGILDIATNTGDGVAILQGTGGLTYGAPQFIPAGSTLSPVVTDFDLNGHLDFAGPTTNGIMMLLANLDGTYQSFDSYVVPGAAGLTVGDFNGDHLTDIFVGLSPSGARVLNGNGAGSFTLAPAVITTPGGFSNAIQFFSLTAANFNGDAATDVFSPAINSVLFGNGDGTFSAPLDLNVILPGIIPGGVADVNQDGRSDILAFGQFQLSFNALLGQTTNTLTVKPITFPVPFNPSGPTAFADFNHDGIIDFVYGAFPGLVPLQGNGDGTFRLLPPVSISQVDTQIALPLAIAAVDMDGDGNTDIVTIQGPVTSTVAVFYGHGDGTFAPPVFKPLSRQYQQMTVADMNGDGAPDVIVGDPEHGVVAVIHSTGSRTFGPEIPYAAGHAGSMAVKDLNGDGLPDVAVVSGPNTVGVLLNQPGLSAPAGTLSVSPEPTPQGAPITATLVLTPATATGLVTFAIDNRPIGTAAVNAGQATLNVADTSLFQTGAYTLTAYYNGDSALSQAVFALPHQIVPVVHPTTVSLTATPNPSLLSQTVRFAVTVASAGPTPFGSVALHDGATNIGVFPLDPTTGTGAFNTALLKAGTHAITAIYEGNINSAPGTSPAVSVLVNDIPTVTSLTVLPVAPQAGASFALSASVTATGSQPNGSVSFFDGTAALGTVELDGTGVAVLVNTFANPGTHSFFAAYNSNGPFAGSTSPLKSLAAQPAGLIAGKMDLSVVQTANDRLLLTADTHLPSASGKNITFLAGSVALGAATIQPSGIAKLEVAGVFPGTHYFTAVLDGDSRLQGSAVTVLFGSAIGAQEFQLRLSAVSVASPYASPTRVSQVLVKADAVNGFSGQIALSCSGNATIQCAIQPTTFVAGEKALITLTPAPTQIGANVPARRAWLALQTVTALVIGLGIFMGPSNRKRANAMLLAVMCLGMMAGCGTGLRNTPQASTVTITATATQAGITLTHSVSLEIR
jgi:hypothetical protein